MSLALRLSLFVILVMCGIAAIFAYHASAPSVNEGELVAIRDRMTARGPDGAGLWLDASRRLGLGHRRLSIIDLSDAGAQPMHLTERQLAIVFNGEIYNYRELRATLTAQGHVFQSTSDTEVLLHLYAEHGEAMVNELRGMYAFALWDGAKRGLFLARDPFGIKPLYVADDGQTLRVASQVKALLAGGKIDTAPESAGHVGFFLWGHVPEPFTLYRGIRSLPAGSTLWLAQDGSQRAKTFCSIPDLLRSASLLRTGWGEGGRRPDEVTFGSGEGLGVRATGEVSNSAFRFQLSGFLKDSVAHHLLADVPVGVFLSSGLDSTTLAALAAEQGGTLRTVTLGFEEFRGTANDETPLAELVARQYGAQHQTVWVKRQDFQDHGDRLFHAMDQPSTDGVNTYFVSHAAKQASLKVALSGLGGDELFGGYPSFTEIPRAVNSLSFLPPGNRLGKMFRFVSAPMLKHFTSPKYAGLLEYGGSFGGAFLLRRGLFMPWELPEILDPDLVREGWSRLNTLNALNATADLSPLRLDRGESDATLAHRMGEGLGVRASGGCSTPALGSSLLAPGSPLPAHLRVSALETCWYMRNQLLRDSDWAGMAHSLEIRVPLVDIQLLRSLLPALSSDTPPTKRDMALAPRSPLPAPVLERPKTGFQVPVRDWLMAESPEFKVQSPKSAERGLRSWAREVHSRFPGADSVLARKSEVRSRKPEGRGQKAGPAARGPSSVVSRPSAAAPISAFQDVSVSAFPGTPSSALRVLALVPDAYGGFGGIAKFNRDLLSALCSLSGVGQVVALPRVISEPVGTLPEKLDFASPCANSKIRFTLAVIRFSALQTPPAVIICGHINLLPLAFLARGFIRFRSSSARPPIVLIIHGVDAWQPTGRKMSDRLAKQVDHVVAVSRVTGERFSAWSGFPADRISILPNSFDPAQFSPGPKDPALLARYGLTGKTIIMTLGRLASQERYKGFDEVLEVMPDLLREFPQLVYLIVGDGSDRARLVAKAKSLGLRVEDGAQAPPSPPRSGRGLGEVSNLSSALRSPLPAPQVIFAGKISEAEKVAHYRLADAYVMPSRGEGFGIVYLEALACGIPVVGSKVDGSREALRDGELGTLVDPDRPDEIKAGIRAALQKPQGQVVAGLDYFSYANFEQRSHELMQTLKS